jgi:hypothetical protein
VAEKISGLITVSAGTPGTVEVEYTTPEDYEYDITFEKKIIFIERRGGRELDIPTEELEVKSSQSAVGVDFSPSQEEFINFHKIMIEKAPDSSINVGVSQW